jgi:hypothetical protein
LVDDVLMKKKENEERRKVLRKGGVCSFLLNCRSCHLVAEMNGWNVTGKQQRNTPLPQI